MVQNLTIEEARMLFDLPATFTQKQFVQKWNEVIIHCHPDKVAQDDETQREANEKMIMLNHAREILRAELDRQKRDREFASDFTPNMDGQYKFSAGGGLYEHDRNKGKMHQQDRNNGEHAFESYDCRDDHQEYKVNEIVLLRGLNSRQDLNGFRCKVVNRQNNQGRYEVEITMGAVTERLRVLPRNMEKFVFNRNVLPSSNTPSPTKKISHKISDTPSFPTKFNNLLAPLFGKADTETSPTKPTRTSPTKPKRKSTLGPSHLTRGESPSSRHLKSVAAGLLPP